MKKPRRKVPPGKTKKPAPPPKVHHRRRGWGGGGPGVVPHHPIHRHKPPAKTPKPRKWSPGTDVACCSAEALGLLLGWGADEVLALYWRTASDLDSGASILDTLTACELPAERFGLRLEECFGPGSFAHDAPVRLP